MTPANHPQSMLAQWYPRRDELGWVLGSVVAVEGSSYRKPGAMMLFNELGQMLGLLSGGCVEKSLFTQVKQVLTLGTTLRTVFDASAQAQVAWQMGLGCGGLVHIQLQPVHRDHHYQQLDRLHQCLSQGRSARYHIALNPPDTNLCEDVACQAAHAWLDHQGHWLRLAVQPRRHLVVLGGGADALPLVALAKQLDWRVSLVDHRPGHADAAAFALADQIVRARPGQAPVAALLAQADAAIAMSHNISLDAEALAAAYASPVAYIGLLGPAHRKARVLDKAGLNHDPRLHGPMGLALGGELPESVALSALAQCHQVLEQGQQVREQFQQSRPQAEARNA